MYFLQVMMGIQPDSATSRSPGHARTIAAPRFNDGTISRASGRRVSAELDLFRGRALLAHSQGVAQSPGRMCKCFRQSRKGKKGRKETTSIGSDFSFNLSLQNEKFSKF